jgi:hypothetical protein
VPSKSDPTTWELDLPHRNCSWLTLEMWYTFVSESVFLIHKNKIVVMVKQEFHLEQRPMYTPIERRMNIDVQRNNS